MSEYVYIGIASIAVFAIADQYEVAYLMGMVTALQYVMDQEEE